MSLLDSRNTSSVCRLRLASSVMTLVIVWGTFQVFRVKRPRLAHPRNQITMVLPLVVRDRVDEHTADYRSSQPTLHKYGRHRRQTKHSRKRTAMDHQPTKECTRFVRSKGTNFKHCSRMGTHWRVPKLVNAKLVGEIQPLLVCKGLILSDAYLRELSPDSLVQFLSIL